MRPIARLLRRPKAFRQPPFWANESVPWSSLIGEKERIETSFEGMVQGAYKANGIVFACILARLLVFSEVRFQYQRFEGGRPAELFGDPSLGLLERPWRNATTAELLARMEQDVSLAGNFYATVVDDAKGRRIRRLRPDWVTIVTGSRSGSPFALDATPVGYIYQPRTGHVVKDEPLILKPEQVAHYSPIPDPEAQWRGMSWLTPVLGEVKADKAATRHKLKFFEHGATLGAVVTYDKEISEEAFGTFVAHFKDQHEGSQNAYKTLHLGGGADVKIVGADFSQMDFKKTQGAGETRVAAAAGVHPVIVGLSEGLQGSALNAGNYAQVRRRFADMTIRPLWRSAAAALEVLATPPEGARLWYQDADVPALQEDVKQEAEIRRTQAQTIVALVRDGFTAESAVAAVTTGDWARLEHTGALSVQLVEPGANGQPKEAANAAQ
ncbi:MAG: phage portal protein [Actinomycetota bacterium]